MKLLMLTRGPEHPATRYRVTPYLDALRGAGIEPTPMRYPHGLTAWLSILRAARAHDAVFVQKKRLPGPLLHWLRRRGTPVIYDFDDAVMFASSRHESPESPERQRRFERMVRGCEVLIAGSDYLKGLVARLHSRVQVVPTSIDTAKYPVREHRNGTGPVVLGWIGGRKSLVFLEALAPVFTRIAGDFPGTSLKIVCNAFFRPEEMPVIEKPWSEAEEAADVASFDVGLSPLPDDPWSRGKCATKLLQCMAAGVPVVASPVGSHLEIVADGRNGLLATTHNEWYDRLSRLIRDPALRRALGAAGRGRVEEAYSVEASAPKLLEAVRSVMAVPR